MDLPGLVLILLGGVVALDQVSFAQIQMSHPAVAGTLAGALAGAVAGGAESAGAGARTGALVGALLGLILAGHRPVGGVVPPDGGVGAVVAAGTLVRAAGEKSFTVGSAVGSASDLHLALALVFGLLLASLGRTTESWTRRVNLTFLRNAESEATAAAVRMAVGKALVLAFMRGALTVAFVLPWTTFLLERAEAARGLAPVLIVGLLGGVGIGAQERLLGPARARGFLLAVVGATLATASALPFLRLFGLPGSGGPR